MSSRVLRNITEAYEKSLGTDASGHIRACADILEQQAAEIIEQRSLIRGTAKTIAEQAAEIKRLQAVIAAWGLAQEADE